jgi:hypothetical protein
MRAPGHSTDRRRTHIVARHNQAAAQRDIDGARIGSVDGDGRLLQPSAGEHNQTTEQIDNALCHPYFLLIVADSNLSSIILFAFYLFGSMTFV